MTRVEGAIWLALILATLAFMLYMLEQAVLSGCP
jgi:hypothetical protein